MGQRLPSLANQFSLDALSAVRSLSSSEPCNSHPHFPKPDLFEDLSDLSYAKGSIRTGIHPADLASKVLHCF